MDDYSALLRGPAHTACGYHAESCLLHSGIPAQRCFPLIIALVFTPTLVTKMHGMYKLNVGSYALATVARALVAVAGYTGSGDVKMMLLFTAIAALGQGPWQGDMNAVIPPALSTLG